MRDRGVGFGHRRFCIEARRALSLVPGSLTATLTRANVASLLQAHSGLSRSPVKTISTAQVSDAGGWSQQRQRL